ncbi:unnamed protein product [Trichobilharzia regenti]|nr:unnamed protein product [Trichobilharzia regenti]
MVVTFKTLKQQTFVLELKEDDLVIHSEMGSEFDASTQKLIHSDTKRLKDYRVMDSGFVVVMSKKITVVDVKENIGSKSSPVSHNSPPAVAATPSDHCNSLVVQELVSMGYERSSVIRAMRADRAFEYLLSGNIPNVDIVEQEGSEGVSPEAPGDVDSINSDDPITVLASLPQFQQMRALVQANPDLLPQLIQQIGNDNADLFRLIQENEQAFLEFLNTPRQTVLTMTADERAAVDRLKALGFPEELVIQVCSLHFPCVDLFKVAF